MFLEKVKFSRACLITVPKSEILRLLDNTLTANYEYSRINTREFTVTKLRQII